MPSEINLYNSFYQYIATGVINLASDTLKVALVTSDYTPNAAHTVLADVNSSPDPEVAEIASPDNGYVTGGAELTSVTMTQVTSPAVLSTLDAENLTWTALTATFRYGILYANVTVDGVVNPLIGYIIFDTTPADITISGIDFIIQWASTGIVTWGPAA